MIKMVKGKDSVATQVLKQSNTILKLEPASKRTTTTLSKILENMDNKIKEKLPSYRDYSKMQ